MQNRRWELSAKERWLGLVVVVGVFLGGAALFLPQQSLWLDEATQMTGVRLGPIGAARWLAGGGPDDTGQIRDRMPPLSDWMGWAWASVFGFEEKSLRWFGVSCFAAAAALVFEAARRAVGTASAWTAGLLFSLSPAVIVLSVEIRAYPLFVFWSALAFHELVRLLAMPPDERRATSYVVLAVALSAAVATHFFGAVLAGSILAALIVLEPRGAGRLRPILGVGGVVAGSFALLLPFIVASFDVSKHMTTRSVGYGPRLAVVKNLLVKLINHVTLSVHRPVSIVALTAAVVLIVVVISSYRSMRRPGIAVALTLGIGLLVVTVAQLVLKQFDAAASNYNAWMRPGFCILLSAGIASESRPLRRAAVLASSLLLAAQTFGVYQLAVHGDHFAHGPQRAIVDLLRTRSPREIALIHDDPSSRVLFLYCPLRFELGRGLVQYQSGPANSLLVRSYPEGIELRPVVGLPNRTLLVVRLEGINPTDLATRVRDGHRALVAGPLSRALLASGDWRLVSEQVVVSGTSARIDMFERRQLTESGLTARK